MHISDLCVILSAFMCVGLLVACKRVYTKELRTAVQARTNLSKRFIRLNECVVHHLDVSEDSRKRFHSLLDVFSSFEQIDLSGKNVSYYDLFLREIHTLSEALSELYVNIEEELNQICYNPKEAVTSLFSELELLNFEGRLSPLAKMKFEVCMVRFGKPSDVNLTMIEWHMWLLRLSEIEYK